MTERLDELDQRVKELRKAFDETFASPATLPERDWVELLLISFGAPRFAVPVSQLAGIEANRPIASLPAKRPGLIGLSAVHGGLVPVFDLGTLLGLPGRDGAPRWMALHHEQELLALAFDYLEGFLRVAARDVYPLESAPGVVHLTGQAIKVDSGLVYVVDIPSVVSAIRRGG
ncbi:MAG: chemotaxis protein CheW [Acidobacteria bacterium]|nr:MAG: chemotaxis protein CheW [Acidobacteriota bacterium]